MTSRQHVRPDEKEQTVTYKFGTTSKNKLKGVHPDLVEVMNEAIKRTEYDFSIVQGVRTAAEQNRLYQKGRTIKGSIVTYKDGYRRKSNHQPKADGYGYSVDFALWTDGKYDWNDIDGFKHVAKTILDVAKEMGIHVRWGADWDEDGTWIDETFLDWGHFELRK